MDDDADVYSEEEEGDDADEDGEDDGDQPLSSPVEDESSADKPDELLNPPMKEGKTYTGSVPSRAARGCTFESNSPEDNGTQVQPHEGPTASRGSRRRRGRMGRLL